MYSTAFTHVQYCVHTCTVLRSHMYSTAFTHVQYCVHTCIVLRSHMYSTAFTHVQYCVHTRTVLRSHMYSTAFTLQGKRFLGQNMTSYNTVMVPCCLLPPPFTTLLTLNPSPTLTPMPQKLEFVLNISTHAEPLLGGQDLTRHSFLISEYVQVIQHREGHIH